MRIILLLLLLNSWNFMFSQTAMFEIKKPCATDSTEFDANKSVGMPSTNPSYEWDFDGNGIFEKQTTSPKIKYVFQNSGNYTVTLRVTGGDTYSKAIQVYDLPNASIIHNNPEICDGDSLLLQVLASSTDVVLWTTAQVNVTEVYVKYEQWYGVTIQDLHKCINRDSVLLKVLPAPVITVSEDITVQEGAKVQLEATGADYYQWTPSTGLSNPNIADPVIYPEETIKFYVQGALSNTCSAIDSVLITVIPNLNMKNNNVFSPNGDGQNDFWKIENVDDYASCELIIYNRWGQQVYQTGSYQNDWDGKSNSNDLPEGAYFYVFKCPINGKVFTGDILLVR